MELPAATLASVQAGHGRSKASQISCRRIASRPRSTKPVGRVVRFNNPAALRPFVAPVATTVIQIQGATTTGTEVFTSGDPMIGATVNLGPNTYLASNMPQNPADPSPAESNQAGFEAMALFECHIDGFFSGTSAAAADRPTASGFNSPLDAAEKAIPQFIDPITGTPTTFIDQATFEQRRLQVLQGAFSALSPAQQTGTPAGRNLNTRITHVQGSTTLPAGWDGYEEYRGIVNAGVTLQPVQSSVLDYLKGFATFSYSVKLFTFHNDELCGYVSGSLSARLLIQPGRALSPRLRPLRFTRDWFVTEELLETRADRSGQSLRSPSRAKRLKWRRTLSFRRPARGPRAGAATRGRESPRRFRIASRWRVNSDCAGSRRDRPASRGWMRRGPACVRTSQELGKLRLARALPLIRLGHCLLLRSRARLQHGAEEKPTELDHGLYEDLHDNGKPVHEFGAVWKLARFRLTRCGSKVHSRFSPKHFIHPHRKWHGAGTTGRKTSPPSFDVASRLGTWCPSLPLLWR